MSDERTDIERIKPEEMAFGRPGYPRAVGYPEAYATGSYGYGEADDRINIRAIWRTVRKRLWLISLIALIVTTIVTLEMFRTKSMYKASTTIEIEKENRTLVKSGDVVISTDESDDAYYTSLVMKTKIRTLMSRPLLEDVVIHLGLDHNPQFMEVTRKKSLVEAVQTIGSKFKQEVTSELPVLEPGVQIEGGIDRSPEESARLAPFVAVLSGNLSPEPLEDTRLLVINYSHTDPKLAATISNTVAAAFINRSFSNKTEKFTKTSDWLNTMDRERRAEVQKAEEELANYTREHNLFSTDGKEAPAVNKLAQLYTQVTTAEVQRKLKESLYQQVKGGNIDVATEAFTDSKLTGLQARLNELEVKARELDVKFGADHPQVVEIRNQMVTIQEQINRSRGDLEARLKAEYERAIRDETALKESLERAKIDAAQQNQDAITFNILRQNVETAKTLYTDFLQKQSQARVQVAEQHNNMRVIEPAQPPGGPIGPNRMRGILIGLFLSLVAGIGLAFVLEYFDNTIKSVEDVNRYAQLAALGIIPAITSSRPKLLTAKGQGALGANGSAPAAAGLQRAASTLATLDTRSSAAEAYRVLRTSVLLSTAGNPPKTILLTSGQPGEGKTFTAIITAISLAQLGASVLIVDCDLRKPSTHKALGIDHSHGLSNYLSRDVAIDGLIQKLPIPNLSILTCGPIPPNPAELISSEKMKNMLAMLCERYDHIVIDSPPLMHVTDPVILSTLVDGVILVVHGGKSTREVLKRGRQELATVGAKIFGVVLNNLDLRREGYDSYYYYRYYGDYSERSVK